MIDTEAIRYRWLSTEGSFPDYEKVIPTEFVASARFDTREAVKATASLGALFFDRETPIIVSIKDGSVTLSVKDDKGEAQIEAEAEGEAQIAISALYLTQALKAVGGIVEVKVKDPSAPMLLTTDGCRLVQMPVFIGLGRKNGEGEAEAVVEGEAPTEPAEGKAQTDDKPKRKRKVKEPVAVT